METANESKPSGLEEEALVHKATEHRVFLKRCIPQNLGEDLTPGQELDHRAEGNLRLGVVGGERVHTAPRTGGTRRCLKQGRGEKVRVGMRGTLTQQLQEVITTRVER